MALEQVTTNAIDILNYVTYGIILLVGIYIVHYNLKTMLFPEKTGKIISFGDFSGCDSCFAGCEAGKSSLHLKVELEDGEICSAEASPCSICIDRLKIGDRVGLTEMGSRLVVQKVSKYAVKRGEKA